jgi:formylglycine-generating enzyme required for sulfatase activity
LRVTAQVAGKVVGCPNCKTKLQVATDLSRLTAVRDRLPTNVEQPVVRAGPATMVEAPAFSPVNPPRLPTIEQPSLVGTDASQAKIDTSVQDRSEQVSPAAESPGLAAARGDKKKNFPVWIWPAVGGGLLAALAMALWFLMSSPTDEVLSDAHWAEYLNTGITITNSIGLELKLIPPGEFMMGDENESPQHRVEITRPFYLSVTEVTQEQYRQVLGENPSSKKGADNPVERVSWIDAVEFCARLSEKEGVEYRLPTEAEWEYACRGGTTTKYSFGDDRSQLRNFAWYEVNAERRHHPVGQKKPNPWGLYDMHGNVREWCQDWYGDYPSGSTTDPTGAASGSLRVSRGGGWRSVAAICRSASRPGFGPSGRSGHYGFRVALSPSGQ